MRSDHHCVCVSDWHTDRPDANLLPDHGVEAGLDMKDQNKGCSSPSLTQGEQTDAPSALTKDRRLGVAGGSPALAHFWLVSLGPRLPTESLGKEPEPFAGRCPLCGQ